MRVNDASNWERAEISSRLGAHLLHPLRHLSVEVPGQIHQQPARPGDAVHLLSGRRLPRDHRPPRHRPARRRHRRLQGAALAAQGPDRLGSAAPRRAGQVHAGRRAVHHRQRARPGAAEARRARRRRGSSARSPRATSSIRDESGATLLEPRRCRLVPGEAVAAVGPVGAGGEYLAEAFARLLEPAAGRMLVDGTPIETLPDSVTGRRIGYAEANTYFPQSSLRDSLIYGLRHAPLQASGEGLRARSGAGASRRSPPATPKSTSPTTGSTTRRPAPPAPRICSTRLREVLRGRRPRERRLPPRAAQPAARGAARPSCRAASWRRATISASGSTQAQAEHYVEVFDPDRYIVNASVMENLVFGVADHRGARRRGSRTIPTWSPTIAETGLEREARRDGAQDRRDADRPVRRSRARTIPCSSAWT